MKCRYCYNPMTAKRIGRRVTLMSRIRKWLYKPANPDLYRVTGFEAPIYPSK